MTAKLILSFDCEGKWGIADRGNARLSALSGRALEIAYGAVLHRLAIHDVPATFAFVAALCFDKYLLKEKIQAAEDGMRFGGRDWLAPAAQDLNQNRSEGWSHPSLLEMVKSDGGHHVCSHGGFHIPYDDVETSPRAVQIDLDLVRTAKLIEPHEPPILVFPRNVVGHLDAVREFGFVGYREIDVREKTKGVVGKGLRLFYEFASFDKWDIRRTRHDLNQGVLRLSPGKFLSASIGLRSHIPIERTLTRIEKFIEFGVETGSIVHFYSHPHNFISDPELGRKLEHILKVSEKHRSRGMLDVSTMREEFNEHAARAVHD